MNDKCTYCSELLFCGRCFCAHSQGKLPLVNPNRVERSVPFFGKRKARIKLLEDRIDYLEMKLNIIEKNVQ